MCTFDSPISRCEVMRVMVLTDVTQRACAEEHGCPRGMVCPLENYFTGEEVVAGTSWPWFGYGGKDAKAA